MPSAGAAARCYSAATREKFETLLNRFFEKPFSVQQKCDLLKAVVLVYLMLSYVYLV